MAEPKPPKAASGKSECLHKSFEANVQVNRLMGRGGLEFNAQVCVICAECGEKFKFLGMSRGVHPTRPAVSFDECEARLPIVPMNKTGQDDKPLVIRPTPRPISAAKPKQS